MKTAFNYLALVAGILLCLVFQSFQPSDSTQTKLSQLEWRMRAANYLYPQENIYLQLDRPSYWANDDIWFKAYLSSNEVQNNIYVELINSSGEVIQKKMYLAINCLAYGDMHLPDTIASGVYQIRSYTNWMRNFDESGFFRKNFIVWNLKNRQVEANKQSMKAREVDVQFFPEGGTFLANVESKMGFKAVDENGIGVDVSGIVTDDDGNMVAGFKSLFKGMGNFSFKPEEGKKYQAIVNVFGKTKKVELPEAQSSGVALAIENCQPDSLQLTLTEHPDNGSTHHKYYLIGQTREIVIFTKEIELNSKAYSLKLNKNKIPTGVLQVTLFDSSLVPKCERLAFINHDSYVDVDLHLNKKTYSTREQVILDMKTSYADTVPQMASLSISAYTTDTHLKLEEYPNNILTHFLLVSDLKGRVEEPAYYFSDSTLETISALDNLMLTQGWRRFTWNEVLENRIPPINFGHESSIIVKGSVVSKLLEKPLLKSTVTLLFDKKASRFYQQETDSMGRFLFDNFYFFDEAPVFLNSVRENGKKTTLIEVDKSSQKSPDVNIMPIDYLLQDNKKVNTTYEVSIKNSGLIERKWHITDTILLDDIDIYGLKKKEEEDNLFLLYNKADYSLKVKDEDVAADIFDLIQYRLPGVEVQDNGNFGAGQSIKLRGNKEPALLLLDGFPIDASVIGAMPLSSFDKVDVVNMAAAFGSKGSNGAVLFTSKKGGQNTEVILPTNNAIYNVQGYSVLREFYSPKYENQKHSVEKTDFRSTLYWHPNIWTNEDGNAQVDFYNSDQPGEVNIVVEGFSTDGRLCRGTCTYTIIP